MLEYVYKYVTFDKKIVYIGRTKNINRRVEQHKKDKLKNFCGDIYYFIQPNNTAATAYEYLLINKYKPMYNFALVNGEKVDVTEPSWIHYTSIGKSNIKNTYWLDEETNQIMYKIYLP